MSRHNEPYHPTELELFQMCPEKYWFSRDTKVNRRYVSIDLIKGQAMHRWLAKYVAPGVSKNDALIGVQELRPIVFSTAEEFKPSEVDMAGLVLDLDDMETMAIHIVQYVHDNGITIVATEKTFEYSISFPYPDPDFPDEDTTVYVSQPFSGTVDVVAIHSDTPDGYVEIWDYKTGRKFTDQWINRKLQFGHYFLAASELGYHVNRVFWAHTQDLVPFKKKSKYGSVGEPKGQFLYPVHVTKEDIPMVIMWTKNIVAAIEAGCRYPVPSALCQGCEYNDSCMKYKIGVSYGAAHDKRFEDNVSKQEDLERKFMEGK